MSQILQKTEIPEHVSSSQPEPPLPLLEPLPPLLGSLLPLLNEENYKQGFLIDEELMGGITQNQQNKDDPETFAAFVLRHTTGEYLGYHVFSSLRDALQAINKITRPWTFELTSGCGNGACKPGGACDGGACKVGA